VTNWNPHAPGTLGQEWWPYLNGSVALNSNLKVAASSFDQSLAEATGQVGIPNVGIGVRGGIYAVEVYDEENGAVVADSAQFAVANEDYFIGAGWKTQSGATTNLYQSIDETVTNTADYVQYSGTLQTYAARFATGALSLTGKRILGVQLRIYTAIGPTGQLAGGLNIGGLQYGGLFSGPTNGSNLSALWVYNPATKKPWTIADVQALDVTDRAYFVAGTQAGAWSAVVIYSAYLVVYTAPETRLAVGTLDDSASGLTPNAWNLAAVTTPTGGTWTKQNSGRHLVTVRRLSAQGAMNVPYLDSKVAPPPGSGWSPTLDATFGHITAMGARLTRLMPVLFRTTVPGDSADSLPYVTQTDAFAVFSGTTARQQVSGASATNYGVINLLVDPTLANADLTVKLKRASDNVQLGTSATITVAEARAKPNLGGGLRAVQTELPTPAALATGTQYYLEFSSTADAAHPWGFAVLNTLALGAIATYNGSTDAPTISGARVTTSELLATLSTLPLPPGLVTASLGAQSVDQTVNCVTGIDRVDLAWTGNALGASFGRYEIEQSLDGGVTWVRIATVVAETVEAWSDYEAPRGIPVQYRIRTVRSDGAFSVWVTVGPVTKPVTNATLFLVSNYNPALNLAYEAQPAKTYDFNEDAARVTTPIYGGDYQLGFQPTEFIGATDTWTLLVGVDDKVPAGGGRGRAAFDPLRTLARAVLPYVCVLDAQGNRTFAMLRVPNGNEDQTGMVARYVAQIQTIQVTDAPYPMPVAAP
jgi:hypothetical protein